MMAFSTTMMPSRLIGMNTSIQTPMVSVITQMRMTMVMGFSILLMPSPSTLLRVATPTGIKLVTTQMLTTTMTVLMM